MGLIRRAIPIVTPLLTSAASSFVKSAKEGLNQGKSVGEALKQGAIDAGTGLVTQGLNLAAQKLQGGNGDSKRIHHSHSKLGKHKHKHKMHEPQRGKGRKRKSEQKMKTGKPKKRRVLGHDFGHNSFSENF
jgi:hypothetical protein